MDGVALAAAKRKSNMGWASLTYFQKRGVGLLSSRIHYKPYNYAIKYLINMPSSLLRPPPEFIGVLPQSD